VNELVEIEAIKRLKYRYLRLLDLKEWEALGACFAEDATVAYGDGKYCFAGREPILQFLRQVLASPTKITSHRCHQPEIDLTSATTASATWALDDIVIDTKACFTLRGAAYYSDTYTKIGSVWFIQSTGYRRIFEEVESRQDTPSLQLTANHWDPSPRPS